MATSGTLRSDRFARLVRDHARGVEVLAQPCPGLADLIEEGHLDDDLLSARLDELTRPLREAGVDTVVLGCTHYAFVQGPVGRLLGPEVELVDTAPAIARRTEQLLAEAGLSAASGEGSLRLLTTGDPEKVAPVVRRLWGAAVSVDGVRI